jgi:ATP-binding cassette subfamily B multidrug efflux pump
LLISPILAFLDTALVNNTILTNMATLVRWRGHRHVMRQSVGWFEGDFAGRIANRVMQTPPAAGEVAFHVFDAMSYALAYVIGAFFLLMQADIRLTLPLVLWFGLYLLLLRYTVKRVGPASKASSDARSELNGRVVDAYTNIHSVKLFAHEGEEIALVLRLNGMSNWIIWAVASFFRELGVVAEGMQTLSQPVTLIDHPNAQVLQLQEARIEITELSHHYGRALGGLEGINLSIPAGQKLGLVGRSGAGKSTLFKLLLRFYDAESGQIYIDGQRIDLVTQDSLRRHIGMVQQESSLMHRSVRDNIRYGNNAASEAQVIAALFP